MIGLTPPRIIGEYKISKSFSDFQPNVGLVGTLSNIFVVPANERLKTILLVPTENWIGSPISAATIEIKNGATILNTLNVFQAVGVDVLNRNANPESVSSLDLKITVVGVLASIDSLTQGNVDIYIETDVLY